MWNWLNKFGGTPLGRGEYMVKLLWEARLQIVPVAEDAGLKQEQARYGLNDRQERS